MNWKDKALQHAKDEIPNEACGLIYIFKGKEKYMPCKNISFDKKNTFTIDPLDWAKTEDKGNIIGVFHSHTNCDPNPSTHDKYSAENTGVKWWIVNPFTNQWKTYEPVGYKKSFIGRPWVWGIYDCWTLTRDYYASVGLNLRDFVRPEDPEEFARNPLFEKYYEELGFRVLNYDEPIKEGDSLLFSIYGNGLNHVGVYVGESKILHHIQGRLSGREYYGEYLQKNTGKRLRHESYD